MIIQSHCTFVCSCWRSLTLIERSTFAPCSNSTLTVAVEPDIHASIRGVRSACVQYQVHNYSSWEHMYTPRAHTSSLTLFATQRLPTYILYRVEKDMWPAIGKRTVQDFFGDSALLVWIISATSPEFNGASLKEKYYSEAELWQLICTRVAHYCRQTFFEEMGVFILLSVLSVYASRKAVYGLNCMMSLIGFPATNFLDQLVPAASQVLSTEFFYVECAEIKFFLCGHKLPYLLSNYSNGQK